MVVLGGVLFVFIASGSTASHTTSRDALLANSAQESIASDEDFSLQNGAALSAFNSLVNMPKVMLPAPNPVPTPEPTPEPTPAPTPLVLADIAHEMMEDTYQYSEESRYQYSDEEKVYIARVVYAEARGEVFEGQVAVATVVLNRFESGQFGNSVKRTVFARNQFAVSKRYNDKVMEAVEAAIERRGDYPDNMYYFRASKSQKWRNFVYLTRIGGHSFYCAAD